MSYQRLFEAYKELIKDLANADSITEDEYLNKLIKQSVVSLHTLEIAEMINGYYQWGEINQTLSEEGLLDIYGDTTR